MAFLGGLGFAAIPAAGPFVALLALASGRIELQRADRWWWLAALLIGLPFVLTESLVLGAMQTLQVLAVWLLFRAAALVRGSLRESSLANDVGVGLVVGLAITLGVGLRAMGEVQLGTSLTLLGAISWQTHPVLFAHAMVVLAALLAVVVPHPRLRATALALGAIAVMLVGSFEAVIAWLVVAFGLRFVKRRGDVISAAIEWSAIALMLVLASGLGAMIGIGRGGFLVETVGTTSTQNHFRGTEVGAGDWWQPLQVHYATRPVRVDGASRTGFVVTKTGRDEWARLQQLVTLRPGMQYTLSAAILLPPEGQRPGLDGWGRPASDGPASMLVSTVADGVLHAHRTGAIRVIRTDLQPLVGDWWRASVHFAYDGDTSLIWYAGVVVDRSDRVGAELTFAELQLSEGGPGTSYVPGAVDRGVTDLRTSRFPIWGDALLAIGMRPWLGWGPEGLPRAIASERPDEVARRPIAAHGHNLILSTAVERGVVGVIGLVLLTVLLALRVVQQRDSAMAVVIAGIVVLNLFDATLLSGAVVYPLAAVLGWRAVGRGQCAANETGPLTAALVRIALAVGDTAVGAIALVAASLIDGEVFPVWSPELGYALLAWPLLASLNGLYPGYGLTRRDELARSVRAATVAAVVFATTALLLRQSFGMSVAAIAFLVPLSVILAPAARWATKWFLRKALLWGRPVVLLGTGPTSRTLVRHMLANPAMGLRPVAVFGSRSGEDGSARETLVRGDVDDAWSFVAAEGIRHVIVSPEVARDISYDEVLRRANRLVRFAQFLPDLHGLPTCSVVASPVGTALGLEVRNQLASGTNRAVKRLMDILGSVVLLVLFGPALLALATWIRFDSRGPALYLSPRLGRHGRHFNCVKFRTMHVDADERLEHLLLDDPAVREEYERFHKLADDPRVTRAGRLLRALSLDELPQLLNVLAGQMSLVGPRPYMVRELEQLGEVRDIIFLARPGMTGYWQVDGRNDVSFAERQAMEADYVRNWSVWWDIELLLRTPAVVLDRTGR